MKTFFRFFISSTAGVMAFVGVAQAEMHNHDGSMHSISGEVRTRYEAVDNIGLADSKLEDAFYNRVRLNFNIMPSDNLKVRITPQATHVWGNETLGTSGTNIFLKEGWMGWMPTDMVGVYVGRQAWSFGNGQVIGERDWDQGAEIAYDSARLQFSFDMGKVDAFWAKLTDSLGGGNAVDAAGQVPTGGNDADLFGLYAAFNLEDRVSFLQDFDLYGLVWWDNATAADNKYYILGARFDGMMNAIDYGLEGTAQFGEIASVDSQKGFYAQGDLGYTFMDKHRVGLQLTYANNEYRNLLGDYHEFLGGADILARRNILAFALMGDFQPTEQIDVGLHGFLFMKAKSDKQLYTAVSSAANIDSGIEGNAFTADSASDKRMAGFEGNFYVGYQPEDHLKFTMGYNAFFKAGYLDDLNSKNVNEFYVQGKMTF